MQKALKEVEKYICSLPREVPEGVHEAYVGGGQSKLTYCGLKVPTIRKSAKAKFRFLSNDPIKDLKSFASIFMESKYFEVKSVALIWMTDKSRKDLVIESWAQLRPLARYIDNWEHSDRISQMYSEILEVYPDKVYPQLVKWNTSKNSWLRRQSIVSLLYYYQLRDKIPSFSEIKALVDPLILDEAFYVQRGVGWTLREMYNAYPEKTYEYIQKRILDLSSVAFSASTEKMSPKQKEPLKKLRKKR